MSAGGSSEEGEEGFELNLAPIIDCFTVLITYLLVSASFLSLSMLEVSTPQAAAPAQPLPPSSKPIALTLLVTEHQGIQLSLTGPIVKQWLIRPKTATAIDAEGLLNALRAARALVGSLQDITVKAEKMVPYRDIARSIEKAKIVFPTVFVGDS